MSKVIDTLKQIQADCGVFFVKLHNYHWNIEGMDFHAVHSALESMYDDIADLMDDSAERVLQLKAKPYVTIKEMLNASKIQEDTGTSFDSKTILKIILVDYEYFLSTFKELSNAAEAEGDKGTIAFADEHIAKLEKLVWMLRAQLG